MGNTQYLHFGDLVLDETCLFARRDGRTIQFTRNERALLLAFFRNPRRLMRRSHLLDAISSSESDPSDRNIDFLVNRLRTKLGDNAKSPKFIATQYGEGYVWVAAPSSVAPTNGFLVIAPAFEPKLLSLDQQGSSMVGRVRDLITTGIGAEYKVLVRENWRPTMEDRLRYLLQLNFNADNGHLNCAATLREMPSKRIVRTYQLRTDATDAHSVTGEADRISDGIVDFLRQAIAAAVAGLGTPVDAPLETRLQQASTRLSASNSMWLANGERLRNGRQQDPANADTALQWCLHLFSRLVHTSPFKEMTHEERSGIESEIEATVLECLPDVEATPMLMLAAAKLLYFINRGHLDLAEDLAERAFARTSDFAAALPVLGQVRQARGDVEGAIIFFDRAIEMAEPGSQFLLHMQVLKCIALLAAGDRPGLEAATAFSLESPHCPPDIGLVIGMMLAPEDSKLPPRLAAALAQIGATGASHAVEMLYFTSARQLTLERARANVMRGLVTHAVRLHGRQAIPAFVLASTGLVIGAGDVGDGPQQIFSPGLDDNKKSQRVRRKSA
ncbi:winged helix-turn-helix domain-containing protein [Rhizobium sp. RCAM05973]|uniref:winged helix-turn-helix domain-containing protein n=1 Tax=Rhizobium sp. RCAM05973 TaxID=2994066 RepID=UPI0022EBC623|nr:winged helix-turn-helix domain-containing protein [Rhizobium sp. RCAM05973]